MDRSAAARPARQRSRQTTGQSARVDVAGDEGVHKTLAPYNATTRRRRTAPAGAHRSEDTKDGDPMTVGALGQFPLSLMPASEAARLAADLSRYVGRLEAMHLAIRSAMNELAHANHDDPATVEVIMQPVFAHIGAVKEQAHDLVAKIKAMMVRVAREAA